MTIFMIHPICSHLAWFKLGAGQEFLPNDLPNPPIDGRTLEPAEGAH
jgi:hypothetical protein